MLLLSHGYRRARFHDRPIIRQYFKRYGDHGTRIYSRRGDLVRGASAHYSRPRFAAVHAVPRVYTGVRVRLAHVDVRAGSDRRGTEKAKEKEEKARRRDRGVIKTIFSRLRASGINEGLSPDFENAVFRVNFGGMQKWNYW